METKFRKKNLNAKIGLVSPTTFYDYRPFWVKNAKLSDGLCHHCSRRRDYIKYAHRLFPQRNPCQEDIDKRHPAFKTADALWLWAENDLKNYQTAEDRLQRYYPNGDHPELLPKRGRESKGQKTAKKKLEKFNERMKEMEGLEWHFRLAQAFVHWDRSIDFVKALGPEWMQWTPKNSLVIGLGGPGTMTNEQKRKLGTCGCVGLMAEYANPNGGPRRKSLSRTCPWTATRAPMPRSNICLRAWRIRTWRSF